MGKLRDKAERLNLYYNIGKVYSKKWIINVTVLIDYIYIGNIDIYCVLWCCRRRSRLAVNFYRRDVGDWALRFLSSLFCPSMPTCPQTCRQKSSIPLRLERAK